MTTPTTQTLVPALVPSLVGGRHVDDGATYEVLDPFDGSVIAAVHDAGAHVAAQAADAAAEAFPQWADMPFHTRSEVLARAAEKLAAREPELIDLAVADTGARREVAATMQVGAAIGRLRAWAHRPESLLTPTGPDPLNGLGAHLVRRPVGVIACISPYNFPLLAMVAKVAPSLFAGNTVVMKPAPQDPLLVSVLAEALDEAVREVGGPRGVINYLVGSTPESGAALVEHPSVRAVSFTGSTTVGVEIYRTAAPTMKRLLLELGGKGALIVREDTPLEAVLPAITRTWTYHAGQVCLTPARVLAVGDVHDRLRDALRERVATLRHGDPRDPDTEVAPLISAIQRDRVAGLIDRAEAAGAKVDRSSGMPGTGFHQAAALVSDVDETAEVMQEEAFGPVLALMQVDDDDHAVRVANSTRYGLYDYVFSADTDAARALATRLQSAQVGINTVARHPGAPFGGNKLSGLGRTGGTYALDTYTDLQALVEPSR